MRRHLENDTDRLAEEPWRRIGESRTERFMELLSPLTDTILSFGEIRHRTRSGCPRSDDSMGDGATGGRHGRGRSPRRSCARWSRWLRGHGRADRPPSWPQRSVRGPRVDRRGLRRRRAGRRAPDRGRRGRQPGRVRGGRQARRPHRPQPRPRDPGYRFEETTGAKTRATAPFSVLSTTDSTPPPSFYSVAAPPRRAQLREDARRDPDRRHRPAAPGQDPGRRAFPDGDRVLGLRRSPRRTA